VWELNDSDWLLVFSVCDEVPRIKRPPGRALWLKPALSAMSLCRRADHSIAMAWNLVAADLYRQNLHSPRRLHGCVVRSFCDASDNRIARGSSAEESETKTAIARRRPSGRVMRPISFVAFVRPSAEPKCLSCASRLFRMGVRPVMRCGL